jgi:hypothetical protein
MKIIDLDRDGYYVLTPHYDPVFYPQTNELTLEQLYGLIGTDMVERVVIQGKADGIIDEEGKLKGKPFNPIASALYNNPHDRIVGTMVVLCGKARMT